MALVDDDMVDMEVEDNSMDERELASIVRNEIESAIGYADTEYDTDRTRAIEYYQGDMSADTPAEEGRSSVVSYDLADTVGEIMPSLMRVFFGGDTVVEYEPSTPDEMQQASQASDYVSYIFTKRCNGYNVLWDAFHDGLVHRNGVLTYYYDKKPKYGVVSYTGLSEEQLTVLASEPDVTLLQVSQDQQILPAPQPGMEPVVLPVFDAKIRHVKERGRIRVEAVPPEEFLINKEATSIEDARFVARRYLTSRSNLRLEGYGRDLIESLPTHNDLELSETRTARFDETYIDGQDESLDESQEEIQIFECYVLTDINGDGISEWVRVVVGGSVGSENTILEFEEWHDEVPFTDLTPERVPHRWQGRSIFDEVKDIQQIKTVLLRHTLDSCYLSNNPDEFVNESAIVDSDELNTRQIGRRVRVKGAPQAAIYAHQLPFIGNHTFPMLDYMDQLTAKRTGISQSSSALDPEVLQNQSATAANLAASAQYSKIELIARNYAEQLRRAFRAILKLVIENTDRPEMIRLNGNFVEFDPRSWNADMDCTVNIGLGTGSRDRDMAMLQAIAMEQDKYLANLGEGNPYVSMEQRVATSRKITEAGGLKNSQMFFSEPTPDQIAQFQQSQAEKAGQPDPETQAKLQQEQMKLDAEVQRQKAEMMLRQEEMQSQTMLKRYQIDQEMSLKREQLAAELDLKRELAMMGLQTSASISDVNVGGQPG